MDSVAAVSCHAFFFLVPLERSVTRGPALLAIHTVRGQSGVWNL